MTNSTYVPKPRELLPDWMVGLTDRVMNYYTKRYLNCEPVILKNPPLPQEGHQYMLYAHVPLLPHALYILHFPSLPFQGMESA